MTVTVRRVNRSSRIVLRVFFTQGDSKTLRLCRILLMSHPRLFDLGQARWASWLTSNFTEFKHNTGFLSTSLSMKDTEYDLDGRLVQHHLEERTS